MPVNDELGKRMKEFYEKPAQTKLIRRMPVAIRIDGKTFHTFTKGFQKPFDNILMKTMQETTKYLCENIQGCVFGFTQSDEITLILTDYDTFTTSAFFDYEVQKLCSIIASMATMKFNQLFPYNVSLLKDIKGDYKNVHYFEEYYDTMLAAASKGAMFDCRCFNIPKEEVTNLIYWRQLDAMRNSVQMVGQANFSQKELQNKSCEKIKEMLAAKGILWEAYSPDCKRGAACRKDENGWYVDRDMPILKEDRAYVDDLIYIGD